MTNTEANEQASKLMSALGAAADDRTATAALRNVFQTFSEGQWAHLYNLASAVVDAPQSLQATGLAAALATNLAIEPGTTIRPAALADAGEMPQPANTELLRPDVLNHFDADPERFPTRPLRRRARHHPLTIDETGPQQRAVLETAVTDALHAQSPKEFGTALKQVMQATGRTQGDIVRHDGRTKEKWLSKSTVSRMVNGTTIGRHPEQVEAFIRACGGNASYVDMWGFVWQEARAAIRENKTTTTDPDNIDPEGANPVETPASQTQNPITPGSAAGSADDAGHSVGTDIAQTEDEALLDIHVRVTKQHLMNAAPVLIAMGLLSTVNGRMPSGRELVVMALLGAAGIALLSHMQRVAQTGNDTNPQSDAPSDTAKENPAGVYMTAPQRRAA